MSGQQSATLAADNDDFFQRIVEEDRTDLNKMLQSQAKLHQMAQGRLSNMEGVARFTNDNNIHDSRGVKEEPWENLGEDACSLTSCSTNMESMLEFTQCNANVDSVLDFTQCNTNLDSVLESTPKINPCAGDASAIFEKIDDETISTCSLSDNSVYTTGSTAISFVTANGKSGKEKGQYGRGKNKLRAIASMIDPNMRRKIKERRGLWSGCYNNQDEVLEPSIEVEYSKKTHKINAIGMKNTMLRRERRNKNKDEEAIAEESIEVVCIQLHPEFDPRNKNQKANNKNTVKEHKARYSKPSESASRNVTGKTLKMYEV